MNPLKFISDLFKHKASTTALVHDDEEIKKKNWEVKHSDLGNFEYNDLGFDINLDNELHSIKWTDIERLRAYKVDLMTTDEICMDITFNNRWIMITEETSGWYQFIERLKSVLPEINNDWEALVLKSLFEYDLTTIYERIDRKMPAKANFYSIIKGKTKDQIGDIFKKNGWTIRKSSMNNYEFENSWTDLVLNSENDIVLLHGLIAYHPDNTKIITQLFNDLDCNYKLEFYDDNNKIIEQTQNGM
ncbi:MAG: hypothetical protein KIT80_13665 [Chitinophagaceae bacterium]|nr:hypothetical protein [Chitinophagaceae bacterium]MCW5927957.1 hypothetical protein [Chitinophagaceae bacterium]